MFARRSSKLVAAVTSLLLSAVPAVFVSLSPGELRAAESAEDPAPPDDIATLRKSRVTLAQKGYESAVAALGHTTRYGNTLVMDGKPEEVYRWSVRWLRAERDVSPKKADQIAALEAHLKRIMKLEKAVDALSKELLPARSRLDAEWYRLEAQLWLAEERNE